MCKALLPADEEHLTDDAIWETLPVSHTTFASTFKITSLHVMRKMNNKELKI